MASRKNENERNAGAYASTCRRARTRLGAGTHPDPADCRLAKQASTQRHLVLWSGRALEEAELVLVEGDQHILGLAAGGAGGGG